MTVDRAVLELRTHMGLDGEEFGEEVGDVTRQAVSYWEGGKTKPRTTHLSAMARLARKKKAPPEVVAAFEAALSHGEGGQ